MGGPATADVEHLGIRWSVPDDWAEVAAEGAVPGVCRILRGPVAAEGLAPTVVLTVHRFPGTLPQLSTVDIATWSVLYPDLHVLSVDESRGGRRIEATATQSGRHLHFFHACTLVDGLGIGLTVTCAESAVPAMDRAAGDMLASLRVPQRVPALDAPGYAWVPDRAPVFAEGHADAQGDPVERLGDLNRRQAWRSAGPVLTSDDLGLLRRLLDSGRGLGRLERAAAADRLEPLVAAGLCEDSGKLTPAGATVVAPMRQGRSSVRVMSRRGSRTSVLQLWRGDQGGTTVLAGADAAAQWAGDPAVPFGDHQVLDMVESGTEAAVIAAWAGAGPTWPVLDADLAVMDTVMDRLVSGGPVAADDLPDPLRGKDLMTWSVQAGPEEAPLVFLNVGGEAHAEVVRETGRAVLVPIGSRNLYRRLRILLEPGLAVRRR